jgi:hypothetical protein
VENEMKSLALDVLAELIADTATKTAIDRMVADLDVIGRRLAEVWPRYTGRLLKLAVKAAMHT